MSSSGPNRYGAWDPVRSMDFKLSRSFEHLGRVARDVLRETLGISPEEEDASAHADDKLMNVEVLRSFGRHEEADRLEADRERKEANDRELNEQMRLQIRKRILDKIDQMLDVIMGVEEKYGELRFGSSSMLRDALMGRVKKVVEEVVSEIPDKSIADSARGWIAKASLYQSIQYDIDSAAKKIIADRIALLARTRSETLTDDVLMAAIDNAMFAEYPMLRRMEAASRLGADVGEKP